MPYLVDGNNLIAQTPGLSMNDPADRRRFVGMLSSFCRTRRAKLTVYFDGEPVEGWRTTTHLGGVAVLHSGRRRSADDAILEHIRDSGAPANITLVTSDKTLFERGRHLGARGMAARLFRQAMHEAAARDQGGSEKPDSSDPGDIDYWLEVFGEETDKPSSESISRRKSSR